MNVKYADFCCKCGAKAIGQFCVRCGSRIMVIDDKPEADPAVENNKYRGLKMVGFSYHRAGMSMGKYLNIIPREDGYDVVESTGYIPWQGMGGGGFSGLMAFGSIGMPGEEEKKAEVPSRETIRASGEKYSLLSIGMKEGDAFFDKITEAGILSWDGFSENHSPGPGVMDGQDTFFMSILFENGRVLRASGSNAYPDGYNEVMGIVNGFFSSHADYSRYYPTEFPEETPGSLSITIGTDLPNHGFYIQVELRGSERKWQITVKDKQGELVAPDTFLVDVGVLDEASAGRLSFRRFIDLLRRYDMGKLNQKNDITQGCGSPDTKEISIYVTYAERRSYRAMFIAQISEYKDFFSDVAREALNYHQEIKDTSIL